MSQKQQPPIISPRSLRFIKSRLVFDPTVLNHVYSTQMLGMKVDNSTCGGHEQVAAAPTEEVCLAERKRAIIGRPKLPNAKKAKLEVPDIEEDGDMADEPTSSSMENNVTIDQFEHVNGRLSVYGIHAKYVITTQEIERRTGAPEYLNSSSLAGLLRRCKVKNCGEDMRNKLKQHGIEVDLCRRKGAQATSITGMCERELYDVAADLDLITKESFPYKEISNCILKEATTFENQQKIVEEAGDFMSVMAHFIKAANSSQPPVSGVPEVKSHNSRYHDEMKEYSLQTHGFGTMNHKTWSHELMKIGKELCDFIPLNDSNDVKK